MKSEETSSGFRFRTSSRLILLAAVVVCSLFVLKLTPAQAQPQLYFADNNAKTIDRMNIDGSGLQVIAKVSEIPLGLAVDPIGSKIYWSVNSPARIYRSNPDGSGREIFYQPANQLEVIDRLAFDTSHHSLYWNGSANQATYIERINADGSGRQTILQNDLTNGPIGSALAIDLVGQRLFFQYQLNSVVASSTLDGSDIHTLFHGTAS